MYVLGIYLSFYLFYEFIPGLMERRKIRKKKWRKDEMDFLRPLKNKRKRREKNKEEISYLEIRSRKEMT